MTVIHYAPTSTRKSFHMSQFCVCVCVNVDSAFTLFYSPRPRIFLTVKLYIIMLAVIPRAKKQGDWLRTRSKRVSNFIYSEVYLQVTLWGTDIWRAGGVSIAFWKAVERIWTDIFPYRFLEVPQSWEEGEGSQVGLVAKMERFKFKLCFYLLQGICRSTVQCNVQDEKNQIWLA